jgi:16S rRNA (cytosine967-C5)-methyltransferase
LAIDLAKGISPARLAAFKILQHVEGGAFSSVLLAAEEPRLQAVDRALCHELVLGSLRWQLLLDRIVEHFSKRRVESLDLAVRIALRLGLYQLRFLTRIPSPAAVNESVNLVRVARLRMRCCGALFANLSTIPRLILPIQSRRSRSRPRIRFG